VQVPQFATAPAPSTIAYKNLEKNKKKKRKETKGEKGGCNQPTSPLLSFASHGVNTATNSYRQVQHHPSSGQTSTEYQLPSPHSHIFSKRLKSSPYRRKQTKKKT
jgi:hypothetical protein